MDEQARPPFPPFDEESAGEKVKKAQDAWNTRDPEKVTLAYTEDAVWRNRDGSNPTLFAGLPVRGLLRTSWDNERRSPLP